MLVLLSDEQGHHGLCLIYVFTHNFDSVFYLYNSQLLVEAALISFSFITLVECILDFGASVVLVTLSRNVFSSLFVCVFHTLSVFCTIP